MWGPPSTGEVILTTSVLGLLSGGEVILALKPALKIFCSTVWGPPSTAFGTPRNCTSCLVHLLSAIARRPPYWNYLCHMICGGQNGGRQHAGPFGSPRNIRLTSEVSVPCTYQSFGSPRKFPFRARGTKYSSEVCRMHAGQAADTSDLPIQSRP